MKISAQSIKTIYLKYREARKRREFIRCNTRCALQK